MENQHSIQNKINRRNLRFKIKSVRNKRKVGLLKDNIKESRKKQAIIDVANMLKNGENF